MSSANRRASADAYVLLFVIASALVFYERCAAPLRISRLQKQTELITKVHELEVRGTNSTPELELARKALIAQTAQLIQEKPISFEFVPTKVLLSLDSLLKFFAGGFIWWLFALGQLGKLDTKEGKDNAIGFVVWAFASGFVGVFIPPVLWPWFHLLIFPWLLAGAIVVAALPVLIAFAVFWSARKKAVAKAQSVNCKNNLKQVGLAARIWSGDHGDVLPPDFASMKPELGSEKIIGCPVGRVPYDILSPKAPLTAPSVVYAYCPHHNHVVLADG